MIYNDRYPTAAELVTGVDITAAVHTISTSFDTLMNPYYIGYIPFEIYPKNWCINTHEITPDTITITQLKQNVPFGFCYQTADYSQLYYMDAGGTCRKYNNNSDCYFINKMCIADLTYVDYIRLEVMVITAPNDKIIDDGAFSFGTPNNSTYDFRRQNFSVIIDISTLNAFINNNGTITINGVIINGQSENVTLSYSDFNNAIAYKTTSTHTIRAQIYNVAIGRSSKYKNGSISANIVPFIGIDCPAGSVPEQRYMALLFEWQSYYTLTYDNLGNFGSLSVGMDVSGYSIGRYQTDHLYRDEIVDLAGQLEYSTLLNMNGWYRHQYFEYSGGNSFRLYPAIDFTDIWYIVGLINKIEIGASSVSAITATSTYFDTQSTALYTDSNETTQNRAIDNYVPDLLYQLQPWQQPNIDITANEFTNDDVPPYTPEPPEDGPDSGGDNILPYDFTNTPLSAANNFTTLYALSTDQVAEFGAIMWAKLADANFWHSVGVTFSNDFSINPADMMRYFNFLRYYPFDLKPYSSTYSSGIFIGRSTIPIQFPIGVEYPRRVNRNLIQIDGGTVTPQLSAPYDSDDFRVMDPSTQIQAHIPFCGSVQLPAAECYGKQLHLKYVIDLQSGAIQAAIWVSSNTDYIIATLAGTCGASVQITANNNIEFLTRIATVATGGVSSAANMATQGARIAGAEGAAVGALAGALTGTVSALAGLPPVTVHRQGNTTGFANYGGDPQAYITIQTPKRSTPATYAKTCGYVSNKQAKIENLSGYTEMVNPDLSGIHAHQDEIAEIKKLLESGFYA